jgi:PAS domain S-box-containing protein
MKRKKISETGAEILPDHDDLNHNTQAKRETATITKVKNLKLSGSPLHFFFILIFGVFVCDALIEGLLSALPPLSLLYDVLLDSTLLSVFVSPLLYFFVFRPMTIRITKLKQAEAELKESVANMRAVFNITDESIFLLAADETIISLNEIAAERLEISREEIIGHKLSDIIPPDIEERRRPFIHRVLANGEHVRLEEELNGRWMVNHLYPIFDDDKQVVRLAIFSSDITQRKMIAEEIKRKNNELHLLNVEKDKFFSIIAHDLRSPFNAFLGLTQMMAEDLPSMSQEEIQKIAVTIRKSATNLYGLLENLLEWSRMQRGVITFSPAFFLLMPKISENMAVLLEAAKNKKVEINYNIPEDLMVYADEYMLGCIIRNISSNAVKFTPQGGKITITAKSTMDNLVEVSIRDTGIGMGKEMIKNLFSLDVNSNRKGTEGEPSTGLGLIICKDFIEKHGGKLCVESEKGKGSTFYFTLPADPLCNHCP